MTRHMKLDREYRVFYKATAFVVDDMPITAADIEEAEETFQGRVDQGNFAQFYLETKHIKIEVEILEIEESKIGQER